MWSTFSIFGAIFCIALANSRIERQLHSSSHQPPFPKPEAKPSPKCSINGQEKHPRNAHRPRQAVTGASHLSPSPRTLWIQSEQVTRASATSPRPGPPHPQEPDNSGEHLRPLGPRGSVARAPLAHISRPANCGRGGGGGEAGDGG